MKHNHRRHHIINRLQKKYKRHLAATVVGATMLSGAIAAFPAPSSPIVHASANSTPFNSLGESIKPGDTNMAALTHTKPSIDTPTEYKQLLNITATAYAPGPHDNGKWGNKTFIGTQVRPGIIAVDPRIIPLGSRVYIQYPDGHGEYATAEDTGGAIKGARIDVAKWTVKEAQDFGIQQVKVFVISSPQKA